MFSPLSNARSDWVTAARHLVLKYAAMPPLLHYLSASYVYGALGAFERALSLTQSHRGDARIPAFWLSRCVPPLDAKGNKRKDLDSGSGGEDGPYRDCTYRTAIAG